jgi:hypothetical protein
MPPLDEEMDNIMEKLVKTGMGYYTRANVEDVWLFTFPKKKNVLRVRRDVRSWILSPIGEHSEKPDRANANIERLFGRPKVEFFEMFARRQYKDWQCSGYELDGLEFSDAMVRLAKGERWTPEEGRQFPESVLNERSTSSTSGTDYTIQLSNRFGEDRNLAESLS